MEFFVVFVSFAFVVVAIVVADIFIAPPAAAATAAVWPRSSLPYPFPCPLSAAHCCVLVGALPSIFLNKLSSRSATFRVFTLYYRPVLAETTTHYDTVCQWYHCAQR